MRRRKNSALNGCLGLGAIFVLGVIGCCMGLGTQKQSLNPPASISKISEPIKKENPKSTGNKFVEKQSNKPIVNDRIVEEYHDPVSGDFTATGKTIYTGPRGGRYHYSKSGKKVYEKHK